MPEVSDRWPPAADDDDNWSAGPAAKRTSDVVRNLITLGELEKQNAALRKVVIDLAGQNATARSILESFQEWNHAPNSDPVETTARFARIIDRIAAFLNAEPPKVPQEVWDATD